MNEFRAEFIDRIQRTKSVMSFRFKPSLQVDFKPGQFAQVLFDEKDKANRNLNKYLSFSCRPGKDCFELTKRISTSDFSKKLLSLRRGNNILFKGPAGNCTLGDARGKYAFLIGGIGITPVISMLEDVAAHQKPADICLLYSNMTNEDIPFLSELDAWANASIGVRVVHIVANCTNKDQKCFTGMITNEIVVNQIPDYAQRIFYIFGPPGMVSAMNAICREIGCLPENVKTENFIGY